MAYKTITFYKYVNLGFPEQLRDEIREHCQKLHLKGRILIAKEGINAAVSGEEKNIEQFKKTVTENKLFTDVTFREQTAKDYSHHKLVVRVRNEIVVFGRKTDLNHKGKYLSPLKLKRWYDFQENFIMVDARNSHEYKVGKFKDALTMPIKNFREFPEQLDLFNQHKNKKIVLYCTGGIRCEKASAYLKEHGFNDVYQLEGGIINYCNQFPDTYWEGGLFVFDDRLVTEEAKPITECQFCGRSEEKYTNCHNLDCDKLFIACENCLEERKYACSEECKNSPRQRMKV